MTSKVKKKAKSRKKVTKRRAVKKPAAKKTTARPVSNGRTKPPTDAATAADDAAQKAALLHAVIDEIKERFVYVVSQKAFFDRATTRMFDKEQIGDAFAERVEKPGALATVVLRAGCPKVVGVTYLPNAPDRVVAEIALGHPEWMFNLWTPSALVEEDGDVQPWLEHLAFLVSDERWQQLILDWFCYLVRHADKKMNWGIVLVGMSGLGKDLLVFAIVVILGLHNVHDLKPLDLKNETFNEWLSCKKLVTADTRHLKNKARDLANLLAPYVAGGAHDRIVINAKYERRFDVPNRASFFVMANTTGALALDPDDRRWFVYESKATAESRPEGYYPQMWDWVRAHAGRVARYLRHEHQLSATFDPLLPPPMTIAKRQMQRRSEEEWVKVLRQRWQAAECPFDHDLVTGPAILKWLQIQGSGRSWAALTVYDIVDALRQFGARSLGQIRLGANNQRERLWAIRNAASYTELSRQELRRRYQAKAGRS